MRTLKELYIAGCSIVLSNSLKKGFLQGGFERLSMLSIPVSDIPNWFNPVKLSHYGEWVTRLYSVVQGQLRRPLLNSEHQQKQQKIKIMGVMLCFLEYSWTLLGRSWEVPCCI